MKKKGNKKDYTTRELVSNIWFSLKYIFKANPVLVWIRAPLLILQTLVTIIPPLFIRQILNEISVDKNINKALIYTVVMAAATLTFNIFSSLLGNLDSRNLEKTSHEIKKRLGESIMDLPYESLESAHMRDFISLAEKSQLFDILTYFSGLFGALLTIVLYSSIILTINPFILLLMICVLIFKALINKAGRKINYNVRNDYAPIIRKVQYYSEIMQNSDYGKEVRVNSIEQWVLNKYTSTMKNEYKTIYFQNTKDNSKLNVFVSFASVFQTAVIYLILSYKVFFSGMLIGDFSLYLTSANSFSSSVEGFMGNISNLLTCAAFAKNFRYCIEEGKQQIKNEESSVITIDKNTIYKIEFKHVYFKYPETDSYVLKDINIVLEHGKSLSIVGVNGSGKTTFVKLLCRLYLPTMGEILVNGISIKEIPISEYSKIIAAVFQDYKLFAFSVSENIQMDLVHENERIDNAIKSSGLQDKINSLPHGTGTYLYKEFDPEGIEFSGGEGQKIAIARALYKNTPIVILDEPTSALDPLAEYEIYKRFHALANGKTAIYISHRLSSTKFTDNVAVFSEGKIVEYGTHKELMSVDKGLYKEMYLTQSQYYIKTDIDNQK